MDLALILKYSLYMFVIMFAFIFCIWLIIVFFGNLIPNYIRKRKFQRKDCYKIQGDVTGIDKSVKISPKYDGTYWTEIKTKFYYAVVNYIVENENYGKKIIPPISQADSGVFSRIINSSEKRAKKLVGKNINILVDKDTKEIFSQEIYRASIKNHILDGFETAIRLALTVSATVFIIGILGQIFNW